MNLFIYGSGAQGRVALDILRISDPNSTVYFIDDNSEMVGSEINNSKVISYDDAFDMESNPKIHIAFGSPFLRRKIGEKIKVKGACDLTIIHPNAFIAGSSRIGRGSIICSHSTINSNVSIGDYTLINNHVLVEHDTMIAPYASISPGTVVGGRCIIGDSAFIGSSVTILARTRIGKESIIGMGSMVLKDVEAGQLYYGVPAVKIKPADESVWKNLF